MNNVVLKTKSFIVIYLFDSPVIRTLKIDMFLLKCHFIFGFLKLASYPLRALDTIFSVSLTNQLKYVVFIKQVIFMYIREIKFDTFF